jgi:molecular chaperone GrpE
MSDPKLPKENGAGDGSAVLEDLEALRSRLAAAESDRDEFRALLQRTQADFENYQKRMSRESQQERRYWNGPLALDLLSALDNLARATEAAQQASETGPLVKGVALVQNQLLDILRRNGITPIEAAGQPFDPNVHQAVMQQPSGNHPPNSVIQVLQQGFMIHDRVLRPAAVVVASEPKKD